MGKVLFKMHINLNLKKYFNLAVVGLIFLSTSLPCFAEENIISSVIISKSKNNQNAYELNIDSSKTVDYKAETEDDGTIYFDLKNSILAQNAGTIYDDVTDIDNVVVKQLDKNKVRVYIKGKNVQNTELVFLNSLFDTKQPAKKIVINRPVNEYKPTSGYSNDLESQEDIQEWNDNSFNFYHFMSETLSGAKDSATGIILIVISLFIFVFITIRTITSKISQDAEPLIGLNNAGGGKNINEYNKTSAPEFQNKEIDFNNIAVRNKMLKNAQKNLAKAHDKYQEYLKNKYKNTSSKPKTIDADSLKKSIALNQYKKNEKNPYINQEVIKMDKINSYNLNQGLIPPRPKKTVGNSFNTSPYIQKPSPKVNYLNNTVKDNDSSLKFLESVSKIYEQSGRQDLAQGLKKSITKSQMKV